MLAGAGGMMFVCLVFRCENLWPELFGVAKTAIGGWFPLVLQTQQ